MKITIDCPYGKYDSNMQIVCTKAGIGCAHQRFCSIKGWCILTEQAKECPLRDREESNGKE